MELSQTAQLILVEVLGRSDALFCPIRRNDWGTGLPGERWQRQRLFRSRGVIFPGGGSAAERKARQRLLDSLQTEGLIQKQTKARTVYVRLTDSGEAMARALCGLAPISAGRLTWERLQELGGKADEFKLADLRLAMLHACECDPEEINRERIVTEELALPGLIRGWLSCRSRFDGLVIYSADREPTDVPPEPAVEWSRELRLIYHEAFNDCRREMRLQPIRELGDLPEPMGVAI